MGSNSLGKNSAKNLFYLINVSTLLLNIYLLHLTRFAREFSFIEQASFHFWGTIILLISMITLQIYLSISGIGPNKINRASFIMNILLTVIALRLLYRPVGPGFFGYDSNLEFANLYMSNRAHHIDVSYNLPAMYALSLFIHYLTGLNLWGIAKFSPTFWSLLSPVIALLYTEEFIKYDYPKSKEYVNFSIISFMMLSFTYMFVLFHSTFHRESLAFVIFNSALLIFSKVRRGLVSYLVFIPLLLVTLVLTHHLTSVLFLIFIIITLVSSNIVNSTRGESVYGFNYHLLAFYAVLLFSFWIYEYKRITNIVRFLVKEISATSEPIGEISVASLIPRTFRYYIILFGEAIFLALMFFIATYGIWKLIRKGRLSLTDASMYLWIVFLYYMTLVSTFGILVPFKGVAFSSRFQIFAMGVMPYMIIRSLLTISKTKQKKVLTLFLIFIFAYTSFQIYKIHPSLYSPYKFAPGEVRPRLHYSELVSSSWVKSTPHVYDRNLRGPLRMWSIIGKGHGAYAKNSFLYTDYGIFANALRNKRILKYASIYYNSKLVVYGRLLSPEG